ncbi:RagB/SusD family nutrient uptake outer membrane protein [Sphingobacterium pedocola]|uniref:RagB/SusD family nutrient uptake outer membrane protein n=1 Tax=Sphingobacterium pedocola TaxID=2082722 RepID=A0ABR9TBA0_9SPHI|nr:RagB/SusD family nutrient uptake outer membrane protein [Sphingobacterium pedocola]MBE8722645.1 RagB/SusD family nutrient uptake outer membrane protein [Sphingobacterium pedocola]
MKKALRTLSFVVLALATASCREYVEIDLVGQRELKYTDDYQSILNTSLQVEQSFYYPILASDDIYSTDETYLNRLLVADANAYTWRSDIVGDNAEDTDWSKLYNQIYKFNLIVAEVTDSQNGTESQKKNILAQAKVHRALNYFYLVNIYAKQYDSNTAAGDLGVPLLTKPDLYARLDRKSVQAIYEQIISDLTSAMPDLSIKANVNILASQVAAKALLARVYLQMRNYDAALQYAEETLGIQSGLVNLNQYIAAPNTYPATFNDPEEILIKTPGNSSPTLALNPALLALFEEGDLRGELFTAEGSAFGTWNAFAGKGYWKHRIISQNGKVTNGPNVPEMMLIKAEALARSANRATEAVTVLDDLRRTRFRPEDFTELSLSDPSEILHQVIAERRKELMAKGLRWFDQKRLANEPGFVTTQTRTYKGETYTLEPNSNRYVLPIASKYIVLNPEIEQNPR